MSNPFFLASGPVGILEQAIQVTLLHGGEYSAGDAQDKLNKDILDPKLMIFTLVPMPGHMMLRWAMLPASAPGHANCACSRGG